MAHHASLAKIHIAKKQLAMDETTYRTMLQNIGGVTSAKDLSISAANKVLAHLARCGFKAKPGKGRPQPQSVRAMDDHPMSQKIRALWLFLHELGAVKNPSEAALAAYVKRLTGVDALQWTDGDEALKLIESLKKWAMRYLPESVQALAKALERVPISASQREAVEEAWSLAQRRQSYDTMYAAWRALDAAINKRSKT